MSLYFIIQLIQYKLSIYYHFMIKYTHNVMSILSLKRLTSTQHYKWAKSRWVHHRIANASAETYWFTLSNSQKGVSAMSTSHEQQKRCTAHSMAHHLYYDDTWRDDDWIWFVEFIPMRTDTDRMPDTSRRHLSGVGVKRESIGLIKVRNA